MATPLSRLPEPGDGSSQAAVTISAVTEYLLPATMRGIAVQAVAALGVLTGLVDRPCPRRSSRCSTAAATPRSPT